MKNKKKIDEIFQQGFKNPDVSPSSRVWKNIKAELEKEQSDRRVIPLWIRLGGVAALIAIMLTVGNLIFDPFHIDKSPVTIENKNDSKPETEKQNLIIPSPKSNEIVSTESPDSISDDLEEISSQKNSISENERIKITESHKRKEHQPKDDSQIASGIKSKQHSEIVSKEKKSTTKKTETFVEGDLNEIQEIVKEEVDIDFDEDIKETDSRPSIMDAIAEQKNVEQNDGEPLTQQRWQITPNVAPVYYSSFGSGSSIDPDFANNPQSGDVNMSYGIQVSYAVNNRLSIRTGLNNVDLSYSTSDIIIASGPASKGLKAVNYGQQDIVITAVNRYSFPENGLNFKSTSGDAKLIQELNYYEIPLELQLKLIDQKIGMNLIGGVSTLLLGENKISVKSSNFSETLGSANNLSNVSFSTNLGIGINYKISKRFLFNLEPTFKYQLNPYSDSSIDFKPYYLGVYSGFSFRF